MVILKKILRPRPAPPENFCQRNINYFEELQELFENMRVFQEGTCIVPVV